MDNYRSCGFCQVGQSVSHFGAELCELGLRLGYALCLQPAAAPCGLTTSRASKIVDPESVVDSSTPSPLQANQQIKFFILGF